MDIEKIITTAIAIFAILLAFFNYRSSARRGLVDELKQEVELLKQKLSEEEEKHKGEIEQRDIERKKLRNRVRFLGKLALQRESELNRALAKIKKWYDWADNMGREYYKLQLQLTAIQQQINPSEVKMTAPLPTLPSDEPH